MMHNNESFNGLYTQMINDVRLRSPRRTKSTFWGEEVSVSFLGTYGNISLWPVVQDRSDMSFVSNGYK